jgi:hypothetical protein
LRSEKQKEDDRKKFMVREGAECKGHRVKGAWHFLEQNDQEWEKCAQWWGKMRQADQP